ncbi:hypothetical protein [Frankia sp. AgB32]|uniref:hypothetical protein n=1 Tax=Frankia sp. AgB32 TaxID=631119 RepID=UPI00200CE3A9|nr:hypothetical protein [Frankia sp. AgB32]MCK9895693.1 hypothetical protein [Frankia sp. AgB32]
MDGANVIGARADGWWRDRPGAARRLVAEIAAWTAAAKSDPAQSGQGELPARIVVVLEGAARSGIPAGEVGMAPPPATDAPPGRPPTVVVMHAPGHGDDAIVAAAAEAGPGPLVITSDRALAERVRALGADTRGARWLRECLGG